MPTDRFDIRYPHPERTPIQLSLVGDRLLVDCRFAYDRRSLRPDPQTGKSPADLIEEGVVQKWSGSYVLEMPDLPDPLAVEVRIRRDRDRRAVPVRLRRLLLMPAHVISPIHRRFWGLFKTGHLESLGANWSPTQPGRMILPLGLDEGLLGSIAAHEAGHLFGIGDAYAALYRFYDAAPGTEGFMMHDMGTVHAQEVRMMLKAHATRRMQFFPVRFHLDRFLRGLRRDAVDRALDLRRRWTRRREKRRCKAPL
jgi:hypothetical protein